MQPLPRNRIISFGLIAAGALTADLWSKQVAFDTLGVFGRTDWMLDQWVRFRVHTNLNFGALWGMGQGFAIYFAILSIGAFAGILYWLFVRRAAESLWLTVSLAFVSGGTLGNLYDRLGLHGVHVPLPGRPGEFEEQPALAVRDFLDFHFGDYPWPIFNVADICLVTGAIMLMVQSIRHRDPVRQPDPSTITSPARETVESANAARKADLPPKADHAPKAAAQSQG